MKNLYLELFASLLKCIVEISLTILAWKIYGIIGVIIYFIIGTFINYKLRNKLPRLFGTIIKDIIMKKRKLPENIHKFFNELEEINKKKINQENRESLTNTEKIKIPECPQGFHNSEKLNNDELSFREGNKGASCSKDFHKFMRDKKNQEKENKNDQLEDNE